MENQPAPPDQGGGFRLPFGLGSIKELADKLPSDDTIQQLLTGLATLWDELPRLERLMQDDRIDAIVKMADEIPSREVLAEIAAMAPYLKTMPTSAEIAALSEKLDNLPGPEEMTNLISLMTQLAGFAEAMKGPPDLGGGSGSGSST